MVSLRPSWVFQVICLLLFPIGSQHLGFFSLRQEQGVTKCTVFVGKISQVAIYSGFSAEVIPKVWYTVCIYMQFAQNILITLPKFNIAPENKPSQKESNLPTTIFGWRW